LLLSANSPNSTSTWIRMEDGSVLDRTTLA
jgi:hypothetical protein